MKLIVSTSLLFALSLSINTAAAEDAKKKWQANATRGKELAQRLCASCHIVSSDQTSAAVAGVPPFRSIANMPGRDDAHITNTLMLPHTPMPDVRLTRHEIADLLAYIAELRKEKPAKNNSGEPAKPAYPKPS